jgi:hypothetical protein
MNYENYLFNMLERAADQQHKPANTADHISFDIPLLMRVFELVREDIKTDMDLHKLVERLIAMKDKGVLTMDDYQEISSAQSSIDSGQMTKPEMQKEPELESLKKLAGI